MTDGFYIDDIFDEDSDIGWAFAELKAEFFEIWDSIGESEEDEAQREWYGEFYEAVKEAEQRAEDAAAARQDWWDEQEDEDVHDSGFRPEDGIDGTDFEPPDDEDEEPDSVRIGDEELGGSGYEDYGGNVDAREDVSFGGEGEDAGESDWGLGGHE